MRKLFLTSVVLLVALMAQAQTKIAPKLENGFKAVYTEKSTISMMGKELAINSDNEYVVSDVTPDGAVITVTNTAMDLPSTEGMDPVSAMMLMSAQITKGSVVKLVVNADGVPQQILNLDEVKEKAGKTIETIVASMFDTMPELSQAMSKEDLKENLMVALTEEKLLDDFDVLALNGKTIANGYQDTFTNGDGMKMKRMYFVAGKKIISNATLDMSKDDLKAFIIKQVEEEAPEQAEMIKENIDMVMGQLKFEATEKNTYQLQDNGWPASINSEKSQDSMGQSIKISSVIELKK
ncbi:MAG: hypothetical protein K5896_08745 [Prevotella sp.]|nr:hypothetical protein [Prevotella sp.]